MLALELFDIGADRGIFPMPLQESTQSGSGIAEQRSMDELDGSGRALDVQEDRANLSQRAAARTGMYAGPMQSG